VELRDFGADLFDRIALECKIDCCLDIAQDAQDFNTFFWNGNRGHRIASISTILIGVDTILPDAAYCT